MLTIYKWSSLKQELNPLSANPTKCSNTIKQFAGNLPTNYLSVFGHFVGLALKGLMSTLAHSVKNPVIRIHQKLSRHNWVLLQFLGFIFLIFLLVCEIDFQYLSLAYNTLLFHSIKVFMVF